jgi:hypothetical protein
MTRLPSLDLYNEAVQNPSAAFIDTQLRNGKVQTNGLGLPLALGGGFAITYNIQCAGKKFAVRVFHKQATGLEGRYRAVSGELSKLPSAYFVQFEYQANGIRVNGSQYPIVKMEWAAGETLGSFLEARHGDRAAMESLRRAFRELANHLRSRGIAHGDIQTGNVMVDGGRIRLIDYDGMFVPGMAAGNGTEIGHRHFQHPGRGAGNFGPSMDRFSFISVDLTLAALAERPGLFNKYATTGENILFTGNDFQDPSASPVFAEIRAIPSLRKSAEDFAAVCQASVAGVPNLEDFLAGKNIPTPTAATTSAKVSRAAYSGSLPVIDATDFVDASKYVGDRVELIGRITDVKVDLTRRSRREYVFLNFGDWRGRIVKVAIWPTGLAKLRQKPDPSWTGKWISVTGLMDPPYSNPRYRYTHLSVTIEESQQLHIIGEDEANYRLGKGGAGRARPATGQDNQRVLQGIRQGTRPAAPPSASTRTGQSATSGAPVSKNQAILRGINSTGPAHAPAPRESHRGRSASPPSRPPVQSSGTNWQSAGSSSSQQRNAQPQKSASGCLIFIAVVVVLAILANAKRF